MSTGTRLRRELTNIGTMAQRLAFDVERPQVDYLRNRDAMDLVPFVRGQAVDIAQLPQARTDGEAEEMLSAASMVAAVRLWRQTRVVYDIDPHMSESLMDMDEDCEFPAATLRRLPHPNPLFLFREPVTVTNYLGGTSAVRGFLLMLRPRLNSVLSTADIDRCANPIYAAIAVVDSFGGTDAVEETTLAELTAPTSGGITTVRKIIDGAAGIVTVGDADTDQAGLREYILQLQRVVIAHMLYVCCDQADIQAPPSDQVLSRHDSKSKGKKVAARPVQVQRVGWRLGPSIHGFQTQVARLANLTGAGGWKVTPHVRKGHPHTFLYGPGKSLRKTLWLPPMLVNADTFGELAQGIVVPVN